MWDGKGVALHLWRFSENRTSISHRPCGGLRRRLFAGYSRDLPSASHRLALDLAKSQLAKSCGFLLYESGYAAAVSCRSGPVAASGKAAFSKIAIANHRQRPIGWRHQQGNQVDVGRYFATYNPRYFSEVKSQRPTENSIIEFPRALDTACCAGK